jgi:hypothetical protein
VNGRWIEAARGYRSVATTAEKLQAITDTADFEILSIRALKELEPSCSAPVHLGINAAGKTIPFALDGFVHVQGLSPTQYVMATFTTTDASRLRSKWLGGKSEKVSTAKRTTVGARRMKLAPLKTVIANGSPLALARTSGRLELVITRFAWLKELSSHLLLSSARRWYTTVVQCHIKNETLCERKKHLPSDRYRRLQYALSVRYSPTGLPRRRLLPGSFWRSHRRGHKTLLC